jgi:hypothetical protein
MYLGLAISTRDEINEMYGDEVDKESDEDTHLSVKLQGYRLSALDEFPDLDTSIRKWLQVLIFQTSLSK